MHEARAFGNELGALKRIFGDQHNWIYSALSLSMY